MAISPKSTCFSARIATWDQALSEYIVGKRSEPFIWGANDCCTFAAGAVVAMTGFDPMAEYRGRYSTAIGSARALKRIGNTTLEGAWDAKFTPVPIGQAERGDLAFADECVGVIVGGFAWFVTAPEAGVGLVRMPRASWDKAWKV
ncbi:MAG: hypothetical protein AAFP79_04940 [Pseudomonadota bacterium]